MRKNLLAIFIFWFCLTSAFTFWRVPAEALYRASDTISISGPNVAANHTLRFRSTKNLPTDGRIVIDFPDEFSFPAELDFSAVDFAVSNSASGPYLDREIAPAASLLADGVAVDAGARTLTINLDSGLAIAAADYFQIEIGTQADYGASSSARIVNPVLTDSYRIEVRTFGAAGEYLEQASVSVAIIDPVTMSGTAGKRYFDAAPVGWLNYGTTETIMSLMTNYPARCRYSTASNTPYLAMTNSFTYASSTGYYKNHSVILSGLTNGGSYDYYVRCADDKGAANTEHECYYSSASTTPFMIGTSTPVTFLMCTDYFIPFDISAKAGSGDGSNSGSGSNPNQEGGSGGGAGGSGGGSGGGAGALKGDSRSTYLPYPPAPSAPGIIFTGWAFPNTEVSFMKDGAEEGIVKSKTDASFAAFLEEEQRGLYTFGIWSTDAAGRRSNTYSTTFWIEAGTQTTVSDIILAPTIAAANVNLTAGQSLDVSGYAAPGAMVEVWLYPEKNTEVMEYEIIKKSGTAAANGSWSLLLDTKDLVDKKYLVKARATITTKGTSGFSAILKINIGEAVVAETGVCGGADLNADGKVNLTDFSILLYHWGTGNECADQNHDGTVNLTDFSIMMFYWTG